MKLLLMQLWIPATLLGSFYPWIPWGTPRDPKRGPRVPGSQDVPEYKMNHIMKLVNAT